MSISEILKSRTVWTAAIGLALAIWQALAPFVDSQLFAVIEAVILAIAGYFRITPNQGVYTINKNTENPLNQ